MANKFKVFKTYTLLLKSHCTYPNYEKEVTAENKKEAIELFLSDPALIEFDGDMIKDKILEE